MNWPKIKTVLICLFLAIDLFLAGWDIMLKRGKSTVSDETIENTVALLADRTVSVSPSLLRKTSPRIKSLTVVNPLADEASFIGKVLGTGYVKDGNRFFTENKEAVIENNSFKITEKRKASSLDEAEAWLNENGFDLSGTVETQYMGSYVWRTVYDGFELFGSSVTVRAEGDSLIAEGCLLYVKDAEQIDGEIKNVTAVLPYLISDGVQNCEIISIAPGYMCTAAGETRFAEASTSPVYRIILSDGREFFYDANMD